MLHNLAATKFASPSGLRLVVRRCPLCTLRISVPDLAMRHKSELTVLSKDHLVAIVNLPFLLDSLNGKTKLLYFLLQIKDSEVQTLHQLTVRLLASGQAKFAPSHQESSYQGHSARANGHLPPSECIVRALNRASVHL